MFLDECARKNLAKITDFLISGISLKDIEELYVLKKIC